jgi:membrane associated rhomboid family serine protease
MLFSSSIPAERRRLFHALVIPSLLSLVIFLVFLLQLGLGLDLDCLGVYPRTLSGAWGILFHPFIHAGWSHLGNNLPAFFILSTALYYFYHVDANRILIVIWLITGVLLWMIGRESYHIGASSIIYGLAFFLFWSGLITPSISLTAISLVVVFWYGSMVWDMFPFLPNETISWEGHLSGAIAGSIAAFVFRRAKAYHADDDETTSIDDEDDALTQLAMKYGVEEESLKEETDDSQDDESSTYPL